MRTIEKLAQRFVKASKQGTKIPLATLEADGVLPDNFEKAMAVQRAFVEASEKTIAGWKLAIRPDGEAVGAPILDCFRVENNNIASFPEAGTEGIEVEICFTLSSDIPARGTVPFTRGDLMRHIGKVHLGVELLRYRLAEKNQVPFPLFLADRLANHGFVVGPEMDTGVLEVFAGNETDLPQLTVTEGSVQLFDATVKHPNGDPLAPLVAFANAAFNKGDMLKAGNVITTGSLCGVIPNTLAQEIHITLKSVGAFTLSGPKP
ncbi:MULTISPECIES: 2-keto-4-pentenoate hydratase [Rhizobium/Agrobacterium group]|uniref:2-keto-4-pentenoate hydratase n=1 Tax=Rhizobium/Agrobacterium group TaxID=227290 RepID=UPI002301946A|nr:MULTISPECIES: 2-keto-4-pentenoate hydratase [Rhizobium/Agrobacterium group]MDA5636340.1 2-keto-4-pentenoate hydratase [Agrobacterium sp. ST15.16.024]MDF1892156.1 2-keto-4-pentenoate hydratase [Rhizobium rhizogenes]